MHEGPQTMHEGGRRTEAAGHERESGMGARAREVTEKGTEKGRETADRAAGKARELAEKQRSSMVNRVSHVASAIRVAADNLAEEDEPRLSEYTRQAADQVEKLAGYVERKDLNALLNDVRRMARRNPTAFLGGGLAAGLMIGRFLRSEPTDEYDGYTERGGRGW